MNEKPIDWRGSSLRDIKDDDVFTPAARKQEMNIDTKSRHVTPVGGNVFADLGFEPEEATALKASSQKTISEKLAVKESLMAELAEWIKTESLEQSDVARILGVTRSRVSDLINKKTIKFTIDALVDMLARTGKHIQLSVQ